jgi:hypothetical protein
MDDGRGPRLVGSAFSGMPASGADVAGDPSTAVKRQLVKGHGVRIVRDNTFNMGDGWERFKPTKGVIGFGDGKAVATDVWDPQLGEADVRHICIGGRRWEYNPKEKRPNGKKWSTIKAYCDLRPATDICLWTGQPCSRRAGDHHDQQSLGHLPRLPYDPSSRGDDVPSTVGRQTRNGRGHSG